MKGLKKFGKITAATKKMMPIGPMDSRSQTSYEAPASKAPNPHTLDTVPAGSLVGRQPKVMPDIVGYAPNETGPSGSELLKNPAQRKRPLKKDPSLL